MARRKRELRERGTKADSQTSDLSKRSMDVTTEIGKVGEEQMQALKIKSPVWGILNLRCLSDLGVDKLSISRLLQDWRPPSENVNEEEI